MERRMRIGTAYFRGCSEGSLTVWRPSPPPGNRDVQYMREIILSSPLRSPPPRPIPRVLWSVNLDVLVSCPSKRHLSCSPDPNLASISKCHSFTLPAHSLSRFSNAGTGFLGRTRFSHSRTLL